MVSLQQRITHTLKGEGCNGSEDGTGRGRPLAVCSVATNDVNASVEASFDTPVYSVMTAHGSSNGLGVGKVAYTLESSGPCAVAYPVSIENQCMKSGATYVIDTQCKIAVAVSLHKRNNIGVAELGGGIANTLFATQGTGDKAVILAKDTVL